MGKHNIVTVGRDPQGPRGHIALGTHTRIIVPLVSKDLASLEDEVKRANSSGCDLLEWRADLFLEDLNAASELLTREATLPVLATWRTTAEGGNGSADPDTYREVVARCASWADAVDIEISRVNSHELIDMVHKQGAKVIASFHDFDGTPSPNELESIVRQQVDAGADIVKFACMPRCESDVEQVLSTAQWVWETFGRHVIGISMGELGVPSRLVGMKRGICATFAVLDTASAPGQLPVHQVREALNA